MKKTMVEYNGKMVEAVDATPKWIGVLPLMLELYTQLAGNGSRTKEQKESLAGLRDEFQKMAQAADQYNDSITKN